MAIDSSDGVHSAFLPVLPLALTTQQCIHDSDPCQLGALQTCNSSGIFIVYDPHFFFVYCKTKQKVVNEKVINVKLFILLLYNFLKSEQAYPHFM